MSSNIPVEIQYRIMSSLSPKDAMPCALVCRDWVAASRKIALSRAIWITVAGLDCDADIFIDLLTHPNSTLRLYLSNVTVDLAVVDFPGITQYLDENAVPIEVLKALVEHGAPLQSLRIEGMHTDFNESAKAQDLVIRLLTRNLPHLHTLDLHFWGPPPDFAQAFLRILSTSHCLTRLTTLVNPAAPQLFVAAPPPSPPPSLRILETNDEILFKAWLFKADNLRQYKLIACVSVMTDMLCDVAAQRGGTMVGLHGTLHIHATYARELANIFFSTPQSVGALTHLMVHSDGFDLGETVNLGLATNLQSLDIELNFECGHNKGEEYTSWIARMLRTTRTGVVVDLTLKIRCYEEEDILTPEAIRELDGAINSYFDQPDNGISSAKVFVIGRPRSEDMKLALCEARAERARNFVFEDSRF